MGTPPLTGIFTNFPYYSMGTPPLTGIFTTARNPHISLENLWIVDFLNYNFSRFYLSKSFCPNHFWETRGL